MFDQFINGDVAGLASGGEDIDEEVHYALISQRDENMTEQIIEFLEQDGENTYFVVVGAAHYCYEGGIVDRLDEMGYDITPFYE